MTAKVMLTREIAFRLETSTMVERRAYIAMHRQLYPERLVKSLEIGGGFASLCGSHVRDEAIGHRAFSRCVGLGFGPPVTETLIEELEAFYDAHGVPTRIDLCPLASAELLPVLSRRGYDAEAFMNVWYRGPEPSRHTANDSIEVRLAGPDERDRWQRVMGQGFATDESITVDPIAHTVSHLPGKLLFLARIEGQVVGAAAAQAVDGVGMVNGAATRPDFRGRGVQQALLGTRINELADRCELMTVITSPGTSSERNVQRVGFGLAYTKVIMARPPRGAAK